MRDFRELREKAERLGYLKASPVFFTLIILHILAFELAAWLVFYHFGVNWMTLSVGAICLVTAQV
jgi:hypothetical protein